jgi:hypothetical protein
VKPFIANLPPLVRFVPETCGIPGNTKADRRVNDPTGIARRKQA